MDPVIKREPVVLPLSILAGLGFLFAGLDTIPALAPYPVVGGIADAGQLAVAAALVGLQFWIRGQVTPADQTPPATSRQVLPEQPEPGHGPTWPPGH